MYRTVRWKYSQTKFAARNSMFKRTMNSLRANRKGVEKLGYHKPIKLWHLKILSKHLKQRINVWSEGRVIYSVGKSSMKTEINVEFVKNNSKSNKLGIGHFTLKGKREFAISRDNKLPNDCLFNVIYAQTGCDPIVQRRLIIRKELAMRKKLNRLKQNPSILRHCLSLSDLQGGAAYEGKSKNDAERILDKSQRGRSHPDQKPGHPRGHASYPDAKGVKDSVENYSNLNRMKTGFLSRTDQDLVAHLALLTNKAQDRLELLNEKGKEGNQEVVTVRPKDLAINDEKLPLAQEWFQGNKIGEPDRINTIKFVMKHFYEKYDDEDEDVFILTLYPTL